MCVACDVGAFVWILQGSQTLQHTPAKGEKEGGGLEGRLSLAPGGERAGGITLIEAARQLDIFGMPN